MTSFRKHPDLDKALSRERERVEELSRASAASPSPWTGTAPT
ncbi:hypothetical protein [Corallococcus sp. AS-1-6]|nr:hypothetical protein [Corallococcus sp. AS-1-6]